MPLAVDPAPAYTLPPSAVLARLQVAQAQGLGEAEVAARRLRHGHNRLPEAAPTSGWRILIAQFESLIVVLLAIAAALSLAFGQWVEGVAVVAVLLINGAIGFLSELRAVRSMEALRRLGSVQAKVRRGGTLTSVDAEQLVPGDIVVLEGGDVVSADMRLIEASKLQADESTLTGESVPVGKSTEALAGALAVGDRRNMLFRGTAITRGAAEAVVVATGTDTELGRIARLVAEATTETTPLERRLDRLGQRLVWVTLAIAAAIAVAGLIAGMHWLLVVETAIALAVATVPEGLPIIATLALARGMRRMARRNAVVNRLSAVETLGAVGIVFTDKTGTLTENRMTLAEFDLPTGVVEVAGTELAAELAADAVSPLRQALELGLLCNDAAVDEAGTSVGDPLEVALVMAGRKAGLRRAELLQSKPELHEVAFDPAVKMMATVHGDGDGVLVAVKGAPEAVLAVATRVLTATDSTAFDAALRQEWERRAEAMAKRGLRVLALASRRTGAPPAQVYADLTLVGLVGLLDPPRSDVRAAIAACRAAGIRVVMVTGDHPATARNIAQAVGLVDTADAAVVLGSDLADLGTELARRGTTPAPEPLTAAIFARVSPEQKLQLIAWQQGRGEIVAMTGDGVNDAPALKKADIGVAMGRRGTEVARQAADVVLRDDAFGTIVAAIRDGRVIFGNIRRFVLYLLSCNISEILVVGLATSAGAPLPVLPLQILFLNLVTDVFPALALGVGEGSTSVMQQPPRSPRERILEPRHWRAIAGFGLLITAAVLGALAVALRGFEVSAPQAVTISFLTLAFAQLWHVFDMRSAGSAPWRNEITANRFVWGALALCVLLLLAAVYLPPLAGLLAVEAPDLRGWLLVLGMSLAPLLIAQVLRGVRRR